MRLLRTGDGPPVVVFLGLDGGGESYLHQVLPVLLPADGPPRGTVRFIDTREVTRATLEEVIDTITGLLTDALGGHREVICWTQSFGAAVMALTLQRKPFDVGRIVLIWLFTRLAPWKLGPARALTALTPTSLFRMAIPAAARLVFGPTGGDRDFPFFTSLTHGTASETTRRVGWMIGADFASTFTALPPVPTRVWFGTRDR